MVFLSHGNDRFDGRHSPGYPPVDGPKLYFQHGTPLPESAAELEIACLFSDPRKR